MEEIRGLTICIPALNEEANLEAAVRGAREVASRHFEDWEILIFNDGSTDETGKIAERLAHEDPRVWAIHHESPRNVGACYAEAIEYSSQEYLVLFPGDNENDPEGLDRIFRLAGQADLILSFTDNPEVRAPIRRFLSTLFTRVLNAISGRRLRYYNGTVLHRLDLLRKCQLNTRGFGYQAELVLQLLKRGHTYREVGIPIRSRPGRRSRALTVRNFLDIGVFLVQQVVRPS
jgi:dolichol-phosphate mannosyltransferase